MFGSKLAIGNEVVIDRMSVDNQGFELSEVTKNDSVLTGRKQNLVEELANDFVLEKQTACLPI